MVYHTTVRVYKHVMSECVHVRECVCTSPGGEDGAGHPPATEPCFPVAPVPALDQPELPWSIHALLSLWAVGQAPR